MRANHVPAPFSELDLIAESLASGVFNGMLIWLFYMAAEPYVRRLWPNSLIAWTRLLDGRFRDPLLGKHLLIGALCGMGFSFYFSVLEYMARWLGEPPSAGSLDGLYFPSISHTVSNYLGTITDAFLNPVAFLLILLLLRVLLRRQWLAFGVFLAIAFAAGFAENGLIAGVFISVFVGAFLTVLTRLGLFAGLVCIVFASWSNFALTLDPSSWYFGRTIVTMLVFTAIALYGFAISLAGQSIFKDSVLDNPTA